MAKEKTKKTNAMRLLDREKQPYTTVAYDPEGGIDGLSVAEKAGEDPKVVFKTLLTRGHSKTLYVFVLPVECELDLKKAATAVGEKNIAMTQVAELKDLTGYIRGGCSPLGMKKSYTTVIDNHAEAFEEILFSAGKIGLQIKTSPRILAHCAKARFADIVTNEETNHE